MATIEQVKSTLSTIKQEVFLTETWYNIKIQKKINRINITPAPESFNAVLLKILIWAQNWTKQVIIYTTSKNNAIKEEDMPSYMSQMTENQSPNMIKQDYNNTAMKNENSNNYENTDNYQFDNRNTGHYNTAAQSNCSNLARNSKPVQTDMNYDEQDNYSIDNYSDVDNTSIVQNNYENDTSNNNNNNNNNNSNIASNYKYQQNALPFTYTNNKFDWIITWKGTVYDVTQFAFDFTTQDLIPTVVFGDQMSQWATFSKPFVLATINRTNKTNDELMAIIVRAIRKEVNDTFETIKFNDIFDDQNISIYEENWKSNVLIIVFGVRKTWRMLAMAMISFLMKKDRNY